MASAINEDGEELFPRKWNEEYIDAPIVEDQNQPATSSEGVNRILLAARGQYDDGGRDRDRTGDLIVANDALSQLSYSPTSSDSSLTKVRIDSNMRKGIAFSK